MIYNLSRPAKVATVAALTVGFIAGGALTATATQAAPRSAASCANAAAAGEFGYTIVDKANGTTCIIKENGTWVDGPTEVAIIGARPAKYCGSFKVLAVRGDVVPKVKVRFIRGKKVVTKYVKLRPGKKYCVKYKFKKKGTTTVIASYKGQRLTIKTVVK